MTKYKVGRMRQSEKGEMKSTYRGWGIGNSIMSFVQPVGGS